MAGTTTYAYTSENLLKSTNGGITLAYDALTGVGLNIPRPGEERACRRSSRGRRDTRLSSPVDPPEARRVGRAAARRMSG